MVTKVEKKRGGALPHLENAESRPKIADLRRAESHVLSMRGSDIGFAKS